MAKATKSRKPGSGARTAGKAPGKMRAKAAGKVAVGAKSRKPAKAAKPTSKDGPAKARKPAAPAAKKVRESKAHQGVERKTAGVVRSMEGGGAVAVLARPEARVVRAASAPRAAVARVVAVVEPQQPAEAETPPALPVPIASFTF